MNIRFHRLAMIEIGHEVDYYESKHVGLGVELEAEIDTVVTMITELPQAGPLWKGRPDLRVAVLQRFPFTMPYQLLATDLVVLALAHTKRRPGYWSRRR